MPRMKLAPSASRSSRVAGPAVVAGFLSAALYSTAFADGNHALNFGVGAYGVCADAPSLNPTSAVTVDAWFIPVVFTGHGNDPIVQKPCLSHAPSHYCPGVGTRSHPQSSGMPRSLPCDRVRPLSAFGAESSVLIGSKGVLPCDSPDESWP
jgi:hypothetical protein